MIVLPVKFLVFLLRILPRSASVLIGRALGWIYGNVIRFRRADALESLRLSFPEKDEAELRRIRAGMYRNLGLTLIDSLRMASMTAEEVHREIVFVDRHNLQNAFDRGKGVVVATAHIGRWETIATIGPLVGYPQVVVVKDVKPKALNDYLVQIRERFGTKIFPRKGSYRPCLKALKQDHKLLGFIMDQNTTRDKGIFVNFFGRPACTSTGGVFLSQQAGAPVLPVFATREPGGITKVHCLPEIEPARDRSPEEILRVTQNATDAIETMIRAYPEQWTWIHRRWRTQPEPSDA